MRMIRRLVCVLVLAGFASLHAQQSGSGGKNRPEQVDKPYVVLVSLDGFKAEYLDRFDLPNLRQLMKRGTRARAMVPVFPSLTFPNHYSLVTGLQPSRHGIVANRFYDPERREAYAYTDLKAVTDGTWYRGEPIWVTAEKQGMVSACFFWPGSEAAVRGIRPTIWNRYDDNVPNAARVKTVLDWLQLPAERRPHIITLYFSELDSVTHEESVDAPEVEQAAKSLDQAVGQLADGIDKLPVRDKVFLLITSDHGMVNTWPTQTIRLDTLLDATELADIHTAFSGPVASIHVKGGANRARELRDRINTKLARGNAYLREELPERFHYQRDPRAGDVVVVMDEAWTLSVPRPPALESTSTSDARPPQGVRGEHGWDNSFPSMRAIFLAVGPGIREGAIVPEVENVDVYPLMTELLGITPSADLDGRSGLIKALISR